jgi:hypothetical protein
MFCEIDLGEAECQAQSGDFQKNGTHQKIEWIADAANPGRGICKINMDSWMYADENGQMRAFQEGGEWSMSDSDVQAMCKAKMQEWDFLCSDKTDVATAGDCQGTTVSVKDKAVYARRVQTAVSWQYDPITDRHEPVVYEGNKTLCGIKQTCNWDQGDWLGPTIYTS